MIATVSAQASPTEMMSETSRASAPGARRVGRGSAATGAAATGSAGSAGIGGAGGGGPAGGSWGMGWGSGMLGGRNSAICQG